jgi:hypothetical protein
MNSEVRMDGLASVVSAVVADRGEVFGGVVRIHTYRRGDK